MLVSLATILQQQYLKTASLYICQFTFALTEKIASLISALAFGDTEMVNVKLCKFYLNNKKLEQLSIISAKQRIILIDPNFITFSVSTI